MFDSSGKPQLPYAAVPPAAPSWAQMEADLSRADPDDVIFKNMAVHVAEHAANSGIDISPESEPVFITTRQLYEAYNKLSADLRTATEHGEALQLSAASLQDILHVVRERARRALLHHP